MRATTHVRRLLVGAAVLGAFAGVGALSAPPGLPEQELDAALAAASTPSTLALLESQFGQRANQLGADSCGAFTPSSSGTRFDGWLLSASPATALKQLKIAFTDADGLTHRYSITANGTSVTATPGTGGSIGFVPGSYDVVRILTPRTGNANGYAIVPASLRALVTATTASGTGTSPGTFQVTGTCNNRQIQPSAASVCQYPDGSSSITAPATYTGNTLSGSLSCGGEPQPGQRVVATPSSGPAQTTTTTSTGSFTFTGLPVGRTTLTFPGSATVPAASPVTVTRTS